MTTKQMAILTAILIIVFLSMRFQWHKKLRGGLPGAMAGLARSIRRGLAGVLYKQTEVQGYDLAYLEGGQGEMVILLHGFGTTKDHWMPVARRLRGKVHMIIPDLPGFGESSRIGHNRYDIVSQVRRLRAFKEKLALPSFHLVGCHSGAAIAGIFASLFAQDVLSLTLIEPFGIDSPEKADVERLATRGWSPLTAGSEKDYQRVLGLLYAKPPKISSFTEQERLAQAIEAQAFEEQAWKQMWENRPYLLEQVLPEIKVRTLLFWGDSNKVAHQSGAKVVSQGIPTVTPVLLRNCAHLMIVERPKEIADRILKFFAGA
ncbi:MAG: alpha/beta fold hydrolase [Acidobacteria bacterium]|nr:alpha/beta fold hydrolase [Acidobacteriota bacterium]